MKSRPISNGASVLWVCALCALYDLCDLCDFGVRSARLGDYSAIGQVTNADYFNLTGSQGISELCAWIKNPVYSFVCPRETAGNYTVGPKNSALCAEGVDVAMSSSEFGNVSVSFGKDELESFRSVNVNNPEEYVYALPLSRYAAPNVLYDGAQVSLLFPEGAGGFASLPSNIFNCFNASAASLRDYYGVEDSLQGSESTAQGSVMFVGTGDRSVNPYAINEYLSLQGLVPNVPLQFSEWGPPNNASQCFEPDVDCAEQMLDTQTQQAFAPQAITFYTPTVNILHQALNGTIDPSVANKYLVMAGYSESEAKDLMDNVDPKNHDHKIAAKKILEQYVLEFFTNTTDSKVRPQVVSLSWTSGEYSSSYEVLEEALKKLALDGMTIMVASGDDGASGNGEKCYNAKNPLVGNHEVMVWPIVSPWVTAVGGTQIMATKDNPDGTEVVCSLATNGGITSGGGFAGSIFPSHLYGRPAWQEQAVTGYLSSNNASTFEGFPTKTTPGYNPEGRAFPDISMYGSWFPTLDSASALRDNSGTSLSAPMAAAIFTLANQKLMEDGYGIIGYANPMLYWMGENCTEAYNDITIGNNKAGAEGADCLYGFPAAPGWDAATGFGSINFGPFVECAKRYQDEVRSKGLEMLPDGSFNTAAALPSNGGSSPSRSPGHLVVISSSLVAGAIALLAALD
jgi:hypothetical protein